MQVHGFCYVFIVKLSGNGQYNVCNVNENICGQLSLMKSIRKLDILSGKTESINGISQINGIENLHLNSLPYLSNVDELTDLPKLEELWINTCKILEVGIFC